MSFAVLFDEYGDPPLRHTLGSLMARARTADTVARDPRARSASCTDTLKREATIGASSASVPGRAHRAHAAPTTWTGADQRSGVG